MLYIIVVKLLINSEIEDESHSFTIALFKIYRSYCMIFGYKSLSYRPANSTTSRHTEYVRDLILYRFKSFSIDRDLFAIGEKSARNSVREKLSENYI